MEFALLPAPELTPDFNALDADDKSWFRDVKVARAPMFQLTTEPVPLTEIFWANSVMEDPILEKGELLLKEGATICDSCEGSKFELIATCEFRDPT
jgi:hypothetical protein